MLRKFFTALVLVMLSFSATADVVNPGHIHKQFMFTNLDKFPAFTYSCLHHSYHYDMGYRPNPVDTILVENNKRYSVGTRGDDKSSLMAMDKDGNYFVSDIQVGGATIVSPSINGLIEVYKIISIENGEIKIKKQKEIIQYANGEEKERKKSSTWVVFLGSDGFVSGLAITSTGALLGMLLLFIFKKRRTKYIQLAT